MFKARARDKSVCPDDARRLLVEVKVTMAVKAKSLDEADELVEALMGALRTGDYEELARLREVVSPGSWRSWEEYDPE